MYYIFKCLFIHILFIRFSRANSITNIYITNTGLGYSVAPTIVVGSSDSSGSGTFSFNEKFLNECPDWVSIQGFFQSEKYFKHIEEEVRKDFSFIDDIKTPCEEMIQSVSNPILILRLVPKEILILILLLFLCLCRFNRL